jgi:S-DNA-T family DNA segregation ATPase FtsK/SpoIIIE
MAEAVVDEPVEEIRAEEVVEENEPEPVVEEPPAERPKSRKKKKKTLAEVLRPATPADDDADSADDSRPATFEGYELPSRELLNPPAPPGKVVKSDLERAAQVLEETLLEFGIEAQVMDVQQGPVVTRYELRPAPGIRVERIGQLSNNIALALKATSVRVQAPVPGKGVVGIEIPNQRSDLVYIRQIMDEVRLTVKADVPLILGKDVTGQNLVVDLTIMPHLLIAGATGSGKTVCMNSILGGILMTRTPEQVRLMLIDPKIVEFSAYNAIPHLVVPVITDPKKVAIGLRWAINEMELRYKMFAKAGVRNITAFNSRPIVEQQDLFGEDPGGSEQQDDTPQRVPYIVIIIDELADLMLAAQADIENCIARLAQLSRAVGIHMILATQRPSVNVITGTIKANFPARIAFQVAQKVDSRTILDTVGAEKLLGRGDMLYHPPGSSKLLRAQGAMITDEETRSLIEHVKEQAQPSYETAIQEKMKSSKASSGAGEMDESDELIEQAVEIIRETQRASTSSLQRRLRIGYTRAARLMDILEAKGIVGPPRGSDPREILIDLDLGMPGAEDEEEEEDEEAASETPVA